MSTLLGSMRGMEPTPSQSPDIARLRAFNRTYTRRLGFLHDRLDDSPFSMAEARVLYELAQRDQPIASEISDALGIDPAQLSRILTQFERQGLVKRRQSPKHAKHKLLTLTRAGRRGFQELNAATNTAIGRLLAGLSPSDRTGLLDATGMITRLLDPIETQARPAFELRPPRTGDLGWITHRQAVLYAEEYGWDWTYEALVAEIVANFVKAFDPAREQVWIAEADGKLVGSIFLVATSDPAVAKLRLLYVEPSARGMGIGRSGRGLHPSGTRGGLSHPRALD